MALNGRQLRGDGGGSSPGKHEACSSSATGLRARCGKAAQTRPSPMGAPAHGGALRPRTRHRHGSHGIEEEAEGQRGGCCSQMGAQHFSRRPEAGAASTHCSTAAGKAAATDDPTAPRSRHPDPCLGPCRFIVRWWRDLLALPFRWAKTSIYPAREPSPQANL